MTGHRGGSEQPARRCDEDAAHPSAGSGMPLAATRDELLRAILRLEPDAARELRGRTARDRPGRVGPSADYGADPTDADDPRGRG